MESILFIHGFGSGKGQYRSIKNYLSKKGVNSFYEFCYKKKFGQVSIKEIAKELSEFISNNVKNKKINIVAFSQGGIIALAYLKYYKNTDVRKLFTICSPHKGSVWAYLLGLPGFLDLRPNSDILKELELFAEKNETDIYSVYTPFDLTVFPGWNAKPKYGKTKLIFAPAHPVAFFWPATKEFIYKNIL